MTNISPDRLPSDPDICGITADSRKVRAGFLFAGLQGGSTDGADFISQAIDNGALAILSHTGVAREDVSVPCLLEKNPRAQLAQFAARFYGRQPDFIAAVTGTNGKTSVANFTRQIWEQLDLSAASLGTLGLQSELISEDVGYTTPEPVLLHRLLSDMSAAGVGYLAMEASSHGLDQNRLDAVRLKAAAFTNLSRDHMDYHSSAEEYLGAKLGLFERVLEPGGVAVLNADLEIYPILKRTAEAAGAQILDFGFNGDALRILSVDADVAGQRLQLSVMGDNFDIYLPLAGDFQAMNALCAAGLVLASGADKAKTIAALAALEPVSGRMEKVAMLNVGASVYLDYAHSPDALDHALKSLRPHTLGKLYVVFGCGGDRDTGKRAVMGRIAAELADIAIVTDDNPRGEDPAAIRAAVRAGCPDAMEIGDREQAIHHAIQMLGADDLLVVAGKGHEQGQIIGDEIRAFDDKQVIQDFAARLNGGDAGEVGS